MTYELEITGVAAEQLKAGERRTVLLAVYERLPHEPMARPEQIIEILKGESPTSMSRRSSR